MAALSWANGHAAAAVPPSHAPHAIFDLTRCRTGSIPLCLLASVAATGLTAACGAGRSGGTAEGSAPVIERIEPASAPAGEAVPVTARIVGGPFDPEGNVVRFDGRVVGEVPSPDGTTLDFPVPKTLPPQGEAAPMVLPPGRYEVTVETAAGVSAPAIFVLERAG